MTWTSCPSPATLTSCHSAARPSAYPKVCFSSPADSLPSKRSCHWIRFSSRPLSDHLRPALFSSPDKEAIRARKGRWRARFFGRAHRWHVRGLSVSLRKNRVEQSFRILGLTTKKVFSRGQPSLLLGENPPAIRGARERRGFSHLREVTHFF